MPYLPAAHLLQVVAPVLLNVLVTEPLPHALQSDALLLPVAVTYLPALQPSHAFVEWVPYLPAAHLLQFVAPVLLNVLVTVPLPHALQSDALLLPVAVAYLPALQPSHACLESVPNFPATQLLHFVAPSLLRVLVTEPAPHFLQPLRTR